MKIVKNYSGNQFIFDSLKKDTDKVRIEVDEDCITIDFNLIIATQFTAGNVKEDFDQLKELLNLGRFSKAPCGGFINFYRVKGNRGISYIVFSGVNEISNSHYLVSIHNIISEN